MADLRNVPYDKLIEKYYLILNNRIDITPQDIKDLIDELNRRNVRDISKESHLDIFVRCLDVERIRQYVKQAFSRGR